jgi:5-methylcytosine-specific restriction endonuclease McrA
MTRNRNTDKDGNSWSKATIKAVWDKGLEIPGLQPHVFKKDVCGALIQFDRYGATVENGCGWEIDHKNPVANGGGDNIENLQPLQWQNNRSKSDDYPAIAFCVISRD